MTLPDLVSIFRDAYIHEVKDWCVIIVFPRTHQYFAIPFGAEYLRKMGKAYIQKDEDPNRALLIPRAKTLK